MPTAAAAQRLSGVQLQILAARSAGCAPYQLLRISADPRTLGVTTSSACAPPAAATAHKGLQHAAVCARRATEHHEIGQQARRYAPHICTQACRRRTRCRVRSQSLRNTDCLLRHPGGAAAARRPPVHRSTQRACTSTTQV